MLTAEKFASGVLWSYGAWLNCWNSFARKSFHYCVLSMGFLLVGCFTVFSHCNHGELELVKDT
jgi:hypothetical protein